jgi:hypothetical protein
MISPMAGERNTSSININNQNHKDTFLYPLPSLYLRPTRHEFDISVLLIGGIVGLEIK